MNITMHKNMAKLEKSIRAKVMDFLFKLDADETSQGLHIEPINHAADKRFRTGRVDKFWRAVLFKLTGKSGTSWVIYGVYPHDEAINMARHLTLDVNPTNGVTEIRLVDRVDAEDLEARIGSGGGNAADAADTVDATDAAVAVNAVDAHPDVATETAAPVSPGTEAAAPVTMRAAADPVFGDKPLSATLGVVADAQLIDDLGLWAEVVAAARQCRTVDELLDGLTTMKVPDWQLDALLDLAAGTSFTDVSSKLFAPHDGSEEAAEAVAAGSGDETDDDAIISGLRTSAAQLSFAEIEDEDELKRVAEGGDFEAWRVFLHPEQRRWATRSYRGPFRLSGGAGTGKTVVLVHRAVRLSKEDTPTPAEVSSAPRVILTTFTRNLAGELDTQVTTLDRKVPRASHLGEEGLLVAGVDQLVFDVLRSASAAQLSEATTELLGRARQNVSNRSNDKDWDRALATVEADLPERARNRVFLMEEYEQVVLPNRLTEKSAYLRVRRPDRGVRLSRQQRALVWEVFEAYRARTAASEAISFDEASHLAAVILSNRAQKTDRPDAPEAQRRASYNADHLLVDEGQDLNPGHWMFLHALVRPGRDDLFIGEDSHQRIYGTKVVLSRFGINIIGRSRRLTLNYRTTERNLAFGLQILAGGDFIDLEDSEESVAGYRSLRVGTTPQVRGFANIDEEFDSVADTLRGWIEECRDDATRHPEQIAVLVRSRKGRDTVVRRMAELGVDVQSVDKGAVPTGTPVAMTMHRAKGTEFRDVVIMNAGKDDIPSGLSARQQPEETVTDFNLRERSLLYVAATRARDRLVVTYSGEGSDLLHKGQQVPEELQHGT